MGREIRRVPKGWVHPVRGSADARTGRPNYQPMFDNDYTTAVKEWDWEEGAPPAANYYRPAWAPEEMTCYQVYETVSEGTPVSPVFETLEDLVQWLIAQGYSEKAARAFADDGWAPSMMTRISPKGLELYENIHALDIPGQHD